MAARVTDGDEADEQRPKRSCTIFVQLGPHRTSPTVFAQTPDEPISYLGSTSRGTLDIETTGTEPPPPPPRPTPMELMFSDPDLLDCPICLAPLAPPVFQCENGHVACEQCCGKIQNKCPSCSCPIGHLRCRWAERFLESLILPCKYAEYGCIEKLRYHIKVHHESSCKYAPCSCPHDGCDYNGMSESLSCHFVEKHQNSSRVIRLDTTMFVSVDKYQKNVFLREGQKTLFVLNHSVQPYGSLVNVVTIAPASSKSNFSYELSATVAENTISLRSFVEPTPKLTPLSPLGKYLIVPKYFASQFTGRFELKLIIRQGVDQTAW